jgi:hypothetical protein
LVFVVIPQACSEKPAGREPGQPYSAKLTPSDTTLRALRAKHGDELETWWKDNFGYGFDYLTESEARYLERADSAQLIRDRLLAARQKGDA